MAKGFGGLPCPKCGDDCSIYLDLDTLNDCTCEECEEEFTVGSVMELVDRWRPIVEWIKVAPERPGAQP